MTEPTYLLRAWGRDLEMVTALRTPDIREDHHVACWWFHTKDDREAFLTQWPKAVSVMRVRVDPGHDDQDEVIDTRACTMADVRLKTPDGREHQFTMKFGYGYPAHSAQFMFRDGNLMLVAVVVAKATCVPMVGAAEPVAIHWKPSNNAFVGATVTSCTPIEQQIEALKQSLTDACAQVIALRGRDAQIRAVPRYLVTLNGSAYHGMGRDSQHGEWVKWSDLESLLSGGSQEQQEDQVTQKPTVYRWGVDEALIAAASVKKPRTIQATTQDYGGFIGRREPTDADFADPRFDAIWNVIKKSDATGNDVCAILDALNQSAAPAVPRSEEPQYVVEVDSDGCGHCSQGKTWTIVCPDGDAIGQSFPNEEDAQSLADLLNEAFADGQRRASPTRTEP